MKKYWVLIFLGILALWSYRVIKEYPDLAEKKDNKEYQAYLADYQTYVEKRYDSLMNRLSQSVSVEYSGKGAPILQPCILSNFEGAEVRLAGIQYYDTILGMKSSRGLGYYKYQCNEASFDPDHPYFGLPDVNIVIGPVEFYHPEENSFAKMFSLGRENEERPYKTLHKQLLVTDSAGNTTIKTFAMELWLARFNVVISIKSTRDEPAVDIPESEMNAKLYPGKWYGRSSRVSINDLDNKKEINDHLYGDLTFSLEINPNASPWYVNMPNMKTARPDIAVAGLFCQSIKPSSLDNRLSINTFSGSLEPLFYFPFEKDDTIKIVGDLDSDVDALVDELNKVNRDKMWNRSYFLRIYSNNIGSRQKLFNQQDDQIRMTFMLPLLVVGSLDVLIPSNILPEWKPPEPYLRKFSWQNLLPKWNLGIGKYFSGLLLIGILIIGGYMLFRFFKGS